jgi:hypothetical protein
MTSLYCQLPGTSPPPPQVLLTDRLRVGTRYEIWAGKLGNEQVCVKLPVVDSTAPSV